MAAEAAPNPSRTDDLRAWIAATPWLMAALRAAREVCQQQGIRHWCIGAGAVRNLVWERLHGRELLAEQLDDIDLAHHTAGANEALDLRCGLLLKAALPTSPLRWEVVNQARVHLWPGAPQGMVPHQSLTAALASWPETATAVGLWLDEGDALQLIAPHGLDDLMQGILRASPGAAPMAFAQRLQHKAFLQRWSGLRLAG